MRYPRANMRTDMLCVLVVWVCLFLSLNVFERVDGIYYAQVFV